MSIKEQIQNLTKHSFIYTLSTFIQRTLGLIMTPIYTSSIYFPTRGQYGEYNLVYVFIAFMNVIYLYGMDAAFMRFYYLGGYGRKDVYKTVFSVVGLTAIVWTALILFFNQSLSAMIFNSPGFGRYVKLAALVLLLDTFSNLPYLILRVEERSVAYSSIRIFRFITELLLDILFVVYLRKGLIGILYANIIASFLNVLVMAPIQWPYLKGRFSKQALRELLVFSLPMIPNAVAYLVVEASDKFVISRVLDNDAVGLYSANYKFGAIFLLLVTAFRTAWQPFFLKLAEAPDAKKIYARVLTYFALLGVLVVTTVGYFIDDLVRLPLPFNLTLMGNAYWQATNIIPIILSAYLFYGLYVNFTVGIFIVKKTRLMFLFTGAAAIVNIIFNYTFLPVWGIMGAAIATLISYFIMAVLLFWANQRIYPIAYEYGRLGIILTVWAAYLAVFYIFHPDLVLRILLVFSMPALFWLSGFLNAREIAAIRNMFKQANSGK